MAGKSRIGSQFLALLLKGIGDKNKKEIIGLYYLEGLLFLF